MTARKFVVSKRGVQREVRRPKASARERLVEYMDLWMSIGRTCPKGRRLLRAHERELAERAVDAYDRYHAAMGGPAANSIRAAILGQPRAKKGAKR